MERGITSRRLWLGVALELATLGMLGPSAFLQLALGRVTLIYNASVVAVFLFLVSGVGWVAVGRPLAALAVFLSRILAIVILIVIGVEVASIYDNNCHDAECYADGAYLWFVRLWLVAQVALPAASALLLCRWGRSVGHGDFGDGAANDDGIVDPAGAPNASAKSV